MTRLGTALGAAAIAGAFVVTLLTPSVPDGGASEELTAPLDTGEHSSREGDYTMPLDGEVVVPFDDPSAPWGAGHRGVDIAGAVGQAVRAAADGVVAFVGIVVDRPVISIDHPDGIRTTYEPVIARVAVGDAVEQGQVIGTLVGDGSHCAPAACLHWGAKVDNDYLDPLSLLTAAVIRLYPSAPRAPPIAQRSCQARGWA